jgi:small GTP-binding protein
MDSFRRNIFKIVLLGKQNVGKTSLIIRFHTDSWNPAGIHTTGETFLTHSMTSGNENITLQIWDTPGQEQFAAQSNYCVRDANCCMVVYDVRDPESYELVESLIERYLSVCTFSNPFVVVIGNKSDLLDSDGQSHELEKLEAAHRNVWIKSFLASARTGEFVVDAFTYAADEIMARRTSESITTPKTTAIETKPAKGEGQCC